MATVAQTIANRANAQKSTGPRSVEGKNASSMNALRHGADAASPIIPGEDPELYHRIAAEYRRETAPCDALESFQVDTLIRADWERRRLKRIEANCYRELLAEGQNPEEIDVKVLRDSPTGKLLRRVWSQISSLERAHSRALAELRRLRAEREQLAVEDIEREMELPAEFQEIMAAKREEFLHRNEPNFTPMPSPNPADNPASLRP